MEWFGIPIPGLEFSITVSNTSTILSQVHVFICVFHMNCNNCHASSLTLLGRIVAIGEECSVVSVTSIRSRTFDLLVVYLGKMK